MMYDQDTLKKFGMVADPPGSTTNLVFKTDGSVEDVSAKWAGLLSQVGGRHIDAPERLHSLGPASCCAPSSHQPAAVSLVSCTSTAPAARCAAGRHRCARLTLQCVSHAPHTTSHPFFLPFPPQNSVTSSSTRPGCSRRAA